MSTFALIKNDVIENIVEGESLAIMQSLLPDFTVIESNKETGYPAIGGKLSNGKFVSPKPFDSWVFDEVTWTWVSPKPMPSTIPGQYLEWNEPANEWEILDLPNFVADEE